MLRDQTPTRCRQRATVWIKNKNSSQQHKGISYFGLQTWHGWTVLSEKQKACVAARKEDKRWGGVVLCNSFYTDQDLLSHLSALCQLSLPGNIFFPIQLCVSKEAIRGKHLTNLAMIVYHNLTLKQLHWEYGKCVWMVRRNVQCYNFSKPLNICCYGRRGSN